MTKKNLVFTSDISDVSGASDHSAHDVVVPDTSGRPKRDIIKEAIEKGKATRDSLMKIAGVNKAGLASQLSYLNLIAKGAGTGFPLQGEDGVFYLGTLAEYEAKNANRGTGKPATPKTAEEILAGARKREDRASSKVANCQKKFDANPSDENTLRLEIAQKELTLAGLLLSKVEKGDYSSEAATLADGTTEGDVPAAGDESDSAMI